MGRGEGLSARQPSRYASDGSPSLFFVCRNRRAPRQNSVTHSSCRMGAGSIQWSTARASMSSTFRRASSAIISASFMPGLIQSSGGVPRPRYRAASTRASLRPSAFGNGLPCFGPAFFSGIGLSLIHAAAPTFAFAHAASASGSMAARFFCLALFMARSIGRTVNSPKSSSKLSLSGDSCERSSHEATLSSASASGIRS
jgi:hypothetical protein